ncbi:hypothetical protein ACFYYS_17860 [Streptomyces sp. NPDC002120]
MHRRTVGETGAALARRRPNPAVEPQREALTVWATSRTTCSPTG